MQHDILFHLFKVSPVAGTQVVDHLNHMSSLQQTAYESRPDEPGSSRDNGTCHILEFARLGSMDDVSMDSIAFSRCRSDPPAMTSASREKSKASSETQPP